MSGQADVDGGQAGAQSKAEADEQARKAAVRAKRVASLEKARAARAASRAALLESAGMSEEQFSRAEAGRARLRGDAAAAGGGRGLPGAYSREEAQRRYKQAVAELGPGGAAVVASGLYYGLDEHEADRAAAKARVYADAPPMDGRGDKTPEFVAWLWEHHPRDADLRYYGRIVPPAGEQAGHEQVSEQGGACRYFN